MSSEHSVGPAVGSRAEARGALRPGWWRSRSRTRMASMRLSLDQYARVSQALALHRIAPDGVFAAEQITAEQWERLKQPLELRIADAEPEAELLAELSEASQRALVWLRRRVRPLDEDATAWFGFLKAYSASAEPMAFLARVGLSEVDLMTLHQLWSARLPELDAETRSRALGAQASVPSIQAEAPAYPAPRDPIGPLATPPAEPAPEEPEIPVFGALPNDD